MDDMFLIYSKIDYNGLLGGEWNLMYDAEGREARTI